MRARTLLTYAHSVTSGSWFTLSHRNYILICGMPWFVFLFPESSCVWWVAPVACETIPWHAGCELTWVRWYGVENLFSLAQYADIDNSSLYVTKLKILSLPLCGSEFMLPLLPSHWDIFLCLALSEPLVKVTWNINRGESGCQYIGKESWVWNKIKVINCVYIIHF